ncbi:MAG: B12-binding domain-containing radical SAM protein [Candidatus Bathyarchaeota archaeon]|nr:B12-binding domain-containing radical SAM protein [Candidatus Bathyarchaeota archaeon]
MKVSFISASPNQGIDEREGKKSIAAFPPLSILYLASVLEERGVEVSVLDQPSLGLTVDEATRWILQEDPDIAGFSTLTSSGQTAALISSKVKQKNPNIVTVFGNHHATFNAERILQKYPSVDVVCRGEGEKTIIDLTASVQAGGDLREVRGISFRRENRVVSAPDQPLIENLDALPFPNRSLLDVNYHCVIAGVNIAPKKFTSIVTSRGCVYGCRFCSCTGIAKNRWRSRSAENTLEELSFLASEGYKQLIFVDDAFTLNPKRVVEICRGIRKERLDLEWICEGRVDACSYGMLREMVQAGCRVFYLGIENATPRILNYFNKKITPAQSETAVKTAKKAGMDVVAGSFIVGAPDETRQEILNTIKFAQSVPIDIPQFNILGAHPGNDIWTEFVAKGFLDPEQYWEGGVAVCKVYPYAKVSLAEILQMIHTAFFEHMRRPSFLLKQFVGTLKSPYRMEVVASNVGRIGEIRKAARSVV